MIVDSNFLNSESQTCLPDVPYEPDLDIEIDFPRGNSSVILINTVTLWAALVPCLIILSEKLYLIAGSTCLTDYG